MIKQKLVVCPKCEGEGKIYIQTQRLHNSDDGHFETCPLCAGFRIVLRIKTIEYKRVK